MPSLERKQPSMNECVAAIIKKSESVLGADPDIKQVILYLSSQLVFYESSNEKLKQLLELKEEQLQLYRRVLVASCSAANAILKKKINNPSIRSRGEQSSTSNPTSQDYTNPTSQEYTNPTSQEYSSNPESGITEFIPNPPSTTNQIEAALSKASHLRSHKTAQSLPSSPAANDHFKHRLYIHHKKQGHSEDIPSESPTPNPPNNTDIKSRIKNASRSAVTPDTSKNNFINKSQSTILRHAKAKQMSQNESSSSNPIDNPKPSFDPLKVKSNFKPSDAHQPRVPDRTKTVPTRTRSRNTTAEDSQTRRLSKHAKLTPTGNTDKNTLPTGNTDKNTLPPRHMKSSENSHSYQYRNSLKLPGAGLLNDKFLKHSQGIVNLGMSHMGMSDNYLGLASRRPPPAMSMEDPSTRRSSSSSLGDALGHRKLGHIYTGGSDGSQNDEDSRTRVHQFQHHPYHIPKSVHPTSNQLRGSGQGRKDRPRANATYCRNTVKKIEKYTRKKSCGFPQHNSQPLGQSLGHGMLSPDSVVYPRRISQTDTGNENSLPCSGFQNKNPKCKSVHTDKSEYLENDKYSNQEVYIQPTGNLKHVTNMNPKYIPKSIHVYGKDKGINMYSKDKGKNVYSKEKGINMYSQDKSTDVVEETVLFDSRLLRKNVPMRDTNKYGRNVQFSDSSRNVQFSHSSRNIQFNENSHTSDSSDDKIPYIKSDSQPKPDPRTLVHTRANRRIIPEYIESLSKDRITQYIDAYNSEELLKSLQDANTSNQKHNTPKHTPKHGLNPRQSPPPLDPNTLENPYKLLKEHGSSMSDMSVDSNSVSVPIPPARHPLVPPLNLQLSNIGIGSWLGGEQTRGDIYMP